MLLVEGLLRAMRFEYPLYPKVVKFGNLDPGDLPYGLQADKELFWVQLGYYKRLREASQVNVVFMGDSCTAWAGWDRFLAEKVADQFPGSGLSYLNAGVPAWSTHQGLMQLRRDVIPLKPKIVTLYYGWNDHWIGTGAEDKTVSAINNSWLFRIRDFRFIQLLQKAWFIASRSDLEQFPKRVSPRDFKNNLTKMVRLARENHIVPVLLTAPTSHVVGREPAYLVPRWLNDLGELVPLHQSYTEMVREVAQAENVPLCDLSREFEEFSMEDNVRRHFLPDGIHLQEKGNRVVANSVWNALAAHDLLKILPSPVDEAIQIITRPQPFYGAPRKRGVPASGLPTRVELDTVRWKAGEILDLAGWALSPKNIDYVVVFVDGKNQGIATNYIGNPEVHRRYPEYADPQSGFTFSRTVALDRGKSHVIRIELYSGSELLLKKEFPLDG